MTLITLQQLAELKAAHGKATPGEWTCRVLAEFRLDAHDANKPEGV